MTDPADFLHGKVKLRLSGEQLERFLNLCKARGLLLKKVQYIETKDIEIQERKHPSAKRVQRKKRQSEESLKKEPAGKGACQNEKQICFWMSLKDFRKIQPIRRKTKVRVHILEKQGLPFILFKGRRHKCFLTGLLLGCILIFWLSGHIWNIHIDGNVKNSTPELLEFLDEQGVIHGIRRKNVNCAAIAAALRKEYPDITFVSARVEGTRLLLTIQEENLIEEKTQREKNEEPIGKRLENEGLNPAQIESQSGRTKNDPSDLVADLEGEIVKIVIRTGVPQMKTGEICKPGDILVSGSIDILNDSQEIVRTEYVAADADIYVRHEEAYYQELPLTYEKKKRTGKDTDSWYLHFGNWIFGADSSQKENYLTSVEEIPWQLTENFALPFSIGKITRTPYEIEACTYTKEQAEKKLVNQLELYEKELTEKGTEIEATSLSIKMEETSCVMKGTLTLIEKCGISQEILSEPVTP